MALTKLIKELTKAGKVNLSFLGESWNIEESWGRRRRISIWGLAFWDTLGSSGAKQGRQCENREYCF